MESRPGTAASTLSNSEREPGVADDLPTLSQAYRRLGVFLYEQGIDAAAIRMFADVLRAIAGFTEALDWVPQELIDSPLPNGWVQEAGIWMKVGSTLAPEFKKDPVGFGLTTWTGARPTIWFNPNPRFLTQGQCVAVTPFEGAVHELGHVTETRAGAPNLIKEALVEVFGSVDRAGQFLSLYASRYPMETWAEATVAANTSAWERFADPRTRERVAALVAAVNRRSDRPLI